MENVSPERLRHIYPLNQLRAELAEELRPTIRIRNYSKGHPLFDFGESPDDYFYVLEGAVTLMDQELSRPQSIGPVSEEEAIPLPYIVPSIHRAHVAVESKLLLVDRRKLIDVMKRNQLSRPVSAQGSYWDNVHDADAEGARKQTWESAVPTQPHIAASGAAASPAPTHAPPATLVSRPERILLVEDHPTDARITQIMLGALGYTADWVRSSSEAIGALERERYDVVLLDVHLPGVDGFETVGRIRERWHGARAPRVIAVTARALKGDREACLAAGMDDYIPKPISIHLLGAKLSSENWAIVDPQVVQRFADAVGRHAVVQLVDSYLMSLQGMVNDVRAALERRQAADLRNAAHSLKAASEVLGVRLVAGYALKLEHLGRSGQLEGAPALLGQIDSIRQETEVELKKIRQAYA